MLAVIVNGLPGSGKTSLAPRLSVALGLPLLSKDAIKETMADTIGVTPPSDYDPLAWNQVLGAAASETIWTLLGHSPCGAVVEAPHLANVRHFAIAGLARAHIADHEVQEVWCDVPAEVARARYEARVATRHPIHCDDRDISAEWAYWLTVARPLAIGAVHRVDTSVPVPDAVVAALATTILS